MSLEWLTVIAGAVSALSWLISALITPDFSISYWGGPPARIRRRATFGTWMNASGALFAAIAIGAQAISTYVSLPQ
nr:hypothetical protein [Brucella intermedia]